MRIPTIGRIVHYTSFGTPKGEYPEARRAAIVTQVHPMEFGDANHDVGLMVVNPTGVLFQTKVQFSDEPKAGCWNWPEINE